MALDIFIRAETPGTIATWLTTAQVRAIIGDLARSDDFDGVVATPPALRGIPGNVDLVLWSENQIVVVPATFDNDGNTLTPAVTDTWAWAHIRLTGDAEAKDFSGPPDPGDFDRWEHSKLVKLMSTGGTLTNHRGVATFENSVGGKSIAIFRASEMAGAGVHFHEYMGGNSY